MRVAAVAVAVLAVGAGAAALLVHGHPRPVPSATAIVHQLRHAVAPLGLPTHLPSRTLDLPILMYHRIGKLKATLPAITLRLTVAPAEFAAQMNWLATHGYHAITQLQAFAALERGASLPAKPVMITFDDGYRDVLGQASPVLERLHMPATEYVITDRMRDPSFLDWGNLFALQQRGFTIGSHTVTHRNLTTLSPAAGFAELLDSRLTLQRHLHHQVPWLAYPEGGVNSTVVALARQAGYVLGVTTEPGTAQSARNPLELHRIEVLDSTSVAELSALLES